MTAPDQAAPPTPPRVGLFGGTFNPIHVGHLRAAEEVLAALELERMIFVPSAEPPHKSGGQAGPIAPAEQRLAWVRAAVAGNPRFAVDALEIERGGPSYSLDTLRTFHARLAPELPVFVIGLDAFGELDSWHEPRALFALAHFAVITRPPATRGRLADWLPECARDDIALAPDGLSGRHRSAASWVRLIEISALDVSASEIRTRLREGRSVRYLLPEAVLAAVTESGAYARP
jgi:nicotinate-nucleotide adenylyltransferase